MKTNDFNKPVTSALIETNLAKQFGTRVNLEKYNREQLEDYRNKLRTRIFQQEGSSKINDLLTNETYQKDKAMLELLNTRIKEMLGEQMKQLRDKIDQLNENKKDVKTTKKPKGAKPDFLDLDKDGNKAEPMKKAAKDAKVKEGAKKADKDYDGDGKIESPKDEVWGSRAKAAAKAGKPFKENFDGDRNADQDTSSKFNKKKTSTGTQYTKKSKEYDKDSSDSGKKDASHLQGMLGGAPKNPVKGRVHKMKEGMKHPKDCDCKECMGMMERDEGKHNNKTTGFKALAKKAGGGEKGAKIAGAQRQKMKKAGQLEESQFKHNVRFVNESLQFLLQEDEEAKAKTITAAGDIVNDYTSWMQRVGQYQTKAIIELADAIKADFGQAEAETFKQSVAPALSATLETTTQQREAISSAVAVLAGEAAPEEPMGMEPDMGADANAGLDMPPPDDMNTPPQAGDEFGAADAAAGDGTTGREMRESREQRRARKLAEEHSIISRLAK